MTSNELFNYEDEVYEFVTSDGTYVSQSDWEPMDTNLDLEEDLRYLDPTMIHNNFSGRTLAGSRVIYKWNNWGQLTVKVDGHELKGRTKGYILAELYEYYFTKKSLTSVGNQGLWAVVKGVLFAGSEKTIECKFVLRGQKVIGVFKPDAGVKASIKWWSKNIYKDYSKNMFKAKKVIDFKPEFRVDRDVYGNQAPEFTRESELEEIRAFIASLKGRRLSNEERELLVAIDSEISQL